MNVMHNVQVTPIIGLPQFNGWSQVATNSKGNVVCAFSVAGLNAGNVGRDIVEAINAANPSTAAEFHQVLQKIVTEVTQKGCQFECSAGMFGQSSATFATYSGHILLKRQEKVGTLLRSEQQLRIIQGQSDIDDVFVLTTGHASNFIGETQQKLIQGYDVDTIITSVVPALHSLSDSSLSSMGFVLILDTLPISAELSENLEEQLPIVTAPGFPPVEPVAEAVPVTEPNFILEPIVKEPVLETTPWTPPPPQLPSKLTQFKAGLAVVIAQFHQIRLSVRGGETYISRTPNRKWLAWLIPLLLVVMVVAAGIFIWRRQNNLQVTQAQTAMAPLLAQLRTAETQIDQNPIQARQDMEKSIQDLEALQSQFEDQPAAKAVVQSQLDQAKAQYQQFSGREELQSLATFYDFRLVASDFVATRADAFGNQGVFLDSEKKQLILLDLTSKQVKALPTLTIDQPRDMMLVDDQLSLLGNGLQMMDISAEDPQLQTVKDQGDSNQDGEFIGYFNRYLYVFNSAKRNIYRYPPVEDQAQYGDPIGWLRPGETVPFDQINSWAIDGDIWMGSKDGRILKYSSGGAAEFSLQGLNEEFSSALVVFTKENIENLYVLEPASQRLVVLKKTGEFVKQYESPSLTSTTALVVSESLQKALAVSGSLVFEISL